MDFLISYGFYLLLGCFAGFLSGLLGVGGGVILVPSFIFLFQYLGFPNTLIMHLAAGTSLAAMITTASFSLYAHYRRGATFNSILYYMIPGLIIGTSLGAVLAHLLHSHLLKMLFGLLLIIVSLQNFLATSPNHQGEKGYQGKKTFAIVASGSFIVGILSGLLGIGGGTLIIPFLGFFGIGIRQAAPVAIVCGLFVALTGTASFILTGFNQPNLPVESLGYVYLPAFIGISLSSPCFSFLGAFLNHRLHVSTLRRIFSVFLLVIGVRLLA